MVGLALLILLRIVRILNDGLGRLSNAFAVAYHSSEDVRVRRAIIVRMAICNCNRVIASTRRHARYVNARARIYVNSRVFRNLPFLLRQVVQTANTRCFGLVDRGLRNLS